MSACIFCFLSFFFFCLAAARHSALQGGWRLAHECGTLVPHHTSELPRGMSGAGLLVAGWKLARCILPCAWSAPFPLAVQKVYCRLPNVDATLIICRLAFVAPCPCWRRCRIGSALRSSISLTPQPSIPQATGRSAPKPNTPPPLTSNDDFSQTLRRRERTHSQPARGNTSAVPTLAGSSRC